MTTPGTAWWGVASSAAAPVLLIGGWTLAGALQRAGFDPVEGTISALAARDADSRWVMTAALAGVGACHLTTAAALRSAAPAGRAVLAAGGVGSLLVAAFPLPTGGGTSAAHTVAAGLAFGALSAWPALALRRSRTTPTAPEAPPHRDATPVTDRPAEPYVPVALRPVVAGTAAATLLGLLGWFVAELAADGPAVGLTERLAAGAQSLWPLATVLSAVSGRRGGGS